jgi:solute carrier family 20 (sodium-dependent phosphate transporter)
MSPALPQYLWLVITGSFAAFMYGYATGSNDLGNAFGTSVGSKTLTLKQATVIASVFEFGGSLLLGRVTSNVLGGGIANVGTFSGNPPVYAYGMVCAMTVGFIWQLLCSRWKLNVSSTYTIVACIIGFSFVWGGPKAVNWVTWDRKLTPPFGGIVPIVLAWVISPLLTGVIAWLLMLTIRTFVLRRPNRVKLSIASLPVSVFLTLWINIFFILTKGAKINNWSNGQAAWVAMVITVGATSLICGIACPILYRRVIQKLSSVHMSPVPTGSLSPDGLPPPIDIEMNPHAILPATSPAPTPSSVPSSFPSSSPSSLPVSKISKIHTYWEKFGHSTCGSKCLQGLKKLKKWAFHGVNVDIHGSIQTDKQLEQMHSHAEQFDPIVEYIFKWLQVFSAICVIFAHGASEVGYVGGPMMAIYNIYQTGHLSASVSPAIWVILIGAFGLVFGLATYGYNITQAMGTELAMISPTRGFCIELATALVILISSQSGLPVSSSIAIVGAIVGVGMLEGVKEGVNWVMFGKQFASWVLTMVVCSIGTAALFAQGVYSPSRYFDPLGSSSG